jgi:hypothetical protein
MRAAFAALFLLGCFARTLPGDIERLPRGTKVRLADVYFDYDTWVQASREEKEQAKKAEPALTQAMRAAFEKEAKRLGIAGDGPDSVKVTIAMVDTYPGSPVADAWLGYGSGQVRAYADVTLRGHGVFEMHTVIPDADVKGRLEELATRIARHIHQRTR